MLDQFSVRTLKKTLVEILCCDFFIYEVYSAFWVITLLCLNSVRTPNLKKVGGNVVRWGIITLAVQVSFVIRVHWWFLPPLSILHLSIILIQGKRNADLANGKHPEPVQY